MIEDERKFWWQSCYSNALAEAYHYGWDKKTQYEHIVSVRRDIEREAKELGVKASYEMDVPCPFDLNDEDEKLCAIFVENGKCLRHIFSNDTEPAEAHRQIDEIRTKYAEAFFDIDFGKISELFLTHIGFIRWDDKSGLFLVPMWAYIIMPPDFVVTSVFGNPSTIGTCDDDTRCGCLAYGIKM